MIHQVGRLTCDHAGKITIAIDDPPWQAVSLPGEVRQLLAGIVVSLYPEHPDDETITPTGQAHVTRDEDLVVVRIYDDPPGKFYATVTGWVYQVVAGDRDRAGLVATAEPPGDNLPEKTHIAVGHDVAATLRILAYRARQPQGGRPNYDATIRHLLRTHPDLEDLVANEMKF